MSAITETGDVDLFTDIERIPLTAPISLTEPSLIWKLIKCCKGLDKSQVQLPHELEMADLSGKWVLITGATSGIGHEAAKKFAECGANLVLACRHPQGEELHPDTVVEQCRAAGQTGYASRKKYLGSSWAEKADWGGQTIEWWEVNYEKLSSIKELGIRWLQSNRTLDILCNNIGTAGDSSISKPAGILGWIGQGIGKAFALFTKTSTQYDTAKVIETDKSTTSPNDRNNESSVKASMTHGIPPLTEDGFELVHQVNFLGHVLLTLLVLPSMASSKDARIICTTSCLHYMGRFNLASAPKGDASNTGLYGIKFYENNKLWFQVWLTELQRRLERLEKYRNVRVHGIHPGYVNTGIWNLRGQPNAQTIAFSRLGRYAANWLGISPQQGSIAILNAALTKKAGAEGLIVELANGMRKTERLPGAQYFNRIWVDTPMPHTRDADCRYRVWRLVNNELNLYGQGLLSELGAKFIPYC